MNTKQLYFPVRGCCVRDKRQDMRNEKPLIGQVLSTSVINGTVAVQWLDGSQRSIPIYEAGSGFKVGMTVIHEEFGYGQVTAVRTIAFFEQVMVEFKEESHRVWLPFHVVARSNNIVQMFTNAHRQSNWSEGQAEQLRLRVLAKCISHWNEMTGALSSFDIDPLPHQIHLVHHIQRSGQPNWLIADDVGLGKTIETGMLIHARRQSNQASRVLLITPAGLVSQWQEELHSKFKLSEFKIYGRDFNIHEDRHWRMYPYVIASIDVLKQEEHLESILNADAWDMVIVDEAHRLSRQQYGLKQESSQRFDLVATLRSYDKIRSLTLLSATPHQGKQDKFQALLELLNPEKRAEILQLADHPELLRDMVFRNCKADVTDAEGNFIFHGKSTLAINVPINQPAREFDAALQAYLRQGYAASSSKGNKGNAIGFVMTTYRKLAASSVAAIELALHRRLKKLIKTFQSELLDSDTVIKINEDERFQGEVEEQFESAANEFFSGEITLLNELIGKARSLREYDEKIHQFKNTILQTILKENAQEKIVIFTEYRATQSYLMECLAEQFGYDKVDLIHGAMNHDERRAAIEKFEGSGQFLISTEAGGEGINLQRQCHVMVNYDLPWNPMRLVQRIGRLYRYGQKKKVVVCNLSAKETADEYIIDLMYRRIATVVEDLATVQRDEYNEALRDDILGQVSDLVDLESVLEAAGKETIARTEERIDEALKKAKTAAELQSQLFESVCSFERDALKDTLVITPAHVKSFVLGVCDQLGIEYQQTHQTDDVWKIRLTDELMKSMSSRRSIREICFTKEVAEKRHKCELMDVNSLLFTTFISLASNPRFGRAVAPIQTSELSGQALFFAELNWQDDRGKRVKTELNGYLIHNGKVTRPTSELSQWLLKPAKDGQYESNANNDKALIQQADQYVVQDLKKGAEYHIYPERFDYIGVGWVNR